MIPIKRRLPRLWSCFMPSLAVSAITSELWRDKNHQWSSCTWGRHWLNEHPLMNVAVLNRSMQEKADISLQRLLLAFQWEGGEMLQVFPSNSSLQTLPTLLRFWELPPSRSHGLQQCTTCLVPEIHSNSPDSSSCSHQIIGRSASKDTQIVVFCMHKYIFLCLASVSDRVRVVWGRMTSAAADRGHQSLYHVLY